jgi:putative Holliday junction resolvase
LQTYSRLIGIDVGSKRIGIAQTDLFKNFATPIGTFPPNEVFNELKKIADQTIIDKFIVGWPLGASASSGIATDRVSSFIGELKKKFPTIEVIKVDERYTSKQAVEVMIKAGIPKKKRKQKERVDQIAAALILERYLEQNF